MSAIPSKPAIIGPWQGIALFVLMWIAVMLLGPALRTFLLARSTYPSTPQAILTFRLLTGLPLSWLALGGTILLLRLRRQSLQEIGWRRPARVWGWIAGAAVVAFCVFGSIQGPWCHGLCFIDPRAWISDWSSFRILTAAGIAITAGVCEEVMFRGFVMTQVRGTPLIVQMLISGLLFGLAHAPVAGLSGQFNAVVAVSVVLSTSVFGFVFAGIYAAGGRSLTPVMVAHGVFGFVTEPWMMLWGLAQTAHHAG